MKYFAIACMAAAVASAYDADKMKNLPDAPAFVTNTFSGFLNVTETK